MIYAQGIAAVLLMCSVLVSCDESKETFAEDSPYLTSGKIEDSSMVALIETNKIEESYNKLLCVATIVTSHWLLTTASCLVNSSRTQTEIRKEKDINYLALYRVRVGAYERAATGDRPGVGGRIYHFDHVRVHHNYRTSVRPKAKPANRFDVALLHVPKSIKFISKKVSPGYLPEPKENLLKNLDEKSLSLALVPNFGDTQRLRFSTMEMAKKWVECTRRSASDDVDDDDTLYNFLPEYFCIQGQAAPCLRTDLGGPVLDLRDSGVVIGVVAHLLHENHCDEPSGYNRALVINTTYVQDWVLDQIGYSNHHL